MSNIQVIVRCRGRNSREIASKSPIVVEVPESGNSVTINPEQHPTDFLTSMNSKTYTVDQVYGAQTDQASVYTRVALPLFRDFFGGFNVTILAYGQTGTGKTYTMCGDTTTTSITSTSNTSTPSLTEDAGIIPRVLTELFANLKRNVDDDFIVKCSFIELYNEELRDLLEDDSNNGGGSTPTSNKLRIFESKRRESSPKGDNQSIIIQNLQEIHVTDAKIGLEILRKGLCKRKTASTKLNDVSSRSHTIFTINLYKKLTNNGGNEDQFKLSKMNLVDLAGSENINKSGAMNQRAKEAGSINQSLLTLGRVINSLSDREDTNNNNNNNSTTTNTSRTNSSNNHMNSSNNSNHIPYRESKLTRLLQDSLGGKTKTALIATISPAKINTEETTSTLEYASRAKNIKNKPQLGQDSELMMKKILLRDMSKEIFKLNNDLIASRQKNGVWMDEKNYKNLLSEHDSIKTDLKENLAIRGGLVSKIEQLKSDKKRDDEELKNLKSDLKDRDSKLAIFKESESNLSGKMIKYEAKITDLEEKLELINSKQNKMNELVGIEIETINGILNNLTKDDINNNIKNIKKSLAGSINNLQNGMKIMKSSTHTKFQNKIPKILSTEFDQRIGEFNKNFEHHSTTTNQGISQLKDSDEKLSEYLTKQCLNSINIESIVSKLVEERIVGKISSIGEELSSNVQNLVNESNKKHKLLVEESVREISKEITGLEREELHGKHSKWKHETNSITKNLLKSSEMLNVQYSDYKRNNIESINKASQNITKYVDENVESGLNGILDQFTSNARQTDQNLEVISKLYQQKTENTMVSLRNTQNSLTNGTSNSNPKSIDSKKREKLSSSPIRGSQITSPIRQLSPIRQTSPIRQSNSRQTSPKITSPKHRLSPAKIASFSQSFGGNSSDITLMKTKIPQLQRTGSGNWEREREREKENSFKRRKF
ncbi:kinesin-like protein Cin8p [[Candida] anglica]|uniref:Kinesin-like protein n=1 Tax=[Candida] anglica TaxID=148631 RepID=A0ABP0EH24_9ASCO